MQAIVQQLEKQDLEAFRSLIQIYVDIFGMEDYLPITNDNLHNALQQPHFEVFVASINNKVVGGLTIYILKPYYSAKGIAYIYDLGVAEQYQRLGIGKQLLYHLKTFCAANNLEEMYVQAEAIDRHAINFYRGTNPSSEMEVVHFNYIINPENKYDDFVR